MDADDTSPQLVNGNAEWNILCLRMWGMQHSQARFHFPKTIAILEKALGARLLGMTFSELAAGADIVPHLGDSNGFIRCHLGLEVPEGFPLCGLRVAAESSGWQEGRITGFTDAYLHSAWNHSSRRRRILIFDVARTEHRANTGFMCRWVISGFILHQVELVWPWVTRTAWRERTALTCIRQALRIPLHMGVFHDVVHRWMGATSSRVR